MSQWQESGSSAEIQVARTRRSIYDAMPVAWEAPPDSRRRWTRADRRNLVAILTGWWILALALAWWVDPTLGALAAFGGPLVILESWTTAISSWEPDQNPSLTLRAGRFAIALIPWGLGLGIAAALMLALFAFSESRTPDPNLPPEPAVAPSAIQP